MKENLIILTFDEYDKLDEEAEEIEIESFPTISEIEEKFNNRNENSTEWLKWVLAVLQCSPDKQYKKEVNQFLSTVLYLTDEEEQKKPGKFYKDTFRIEDMERVAKKVSEMEYQSDYYYPTVDELKKHDFSCSETDIAYLTWLVQTTAKLTDDEEKTRTFAKKKLQEILAKCM